MLKTEQERLAALANADPHLRAMIFSAMAAALPSVELKQVNDVSKHGHWVYPMILVADWLQRHLTTDEVAGEARQLREAYAEWLAEVRTEAEANNARQLHGSVVSADKKAATAALLADLNLNF